MGGRLSQSLSELNTVSFPPPFLLTSDDGSSCSSRWDSIEGRRGGGKRGRSSCNESDFTIQKPSRSRDKYDEATRLQQEEAPLYDTGTSTSTSSVVPPPAGTQSLDKTSHERRGQSCPTSPVPKKRTRTRTRRVVIKNYFRGGESFRRYYSSPPSPASSLDSTSQRLRELPFERMGNFKNLATTTTSTGRGFTKKEETLLPPGTRTQLVGGRTEHQELPTIIACNKSPEQEDETRMKEQEELSCIEEDDTIISAENELDPVSSSEEEQGDMEESGTTSSASESAAVGVYSTPNNSLQQQQQQRSSSALMKEASSHEPPDQSLLHHTTYRGYRGGTSTRRTGRGPLAAAALIEQFQFSTPPFASLQGDQTLPPLDFSAKRGRSPRCKTTTSMNEQDAMDHIIESTSRLLVDYKYQR